MLYILLALAVLVLWRVLVAVRARRQAPPPPMPDHWRVSLETDVRSYAQLPAQDKLRFEQRMMRFLEDVRITGISTDITEQDRILIAASAVIPIFGFPDWHYRGLREVLLYPSAFNEQYAVTGAGRDRLGQVGSGTMGGKMILSRPALQQGFSNESSKTHVGIHEFVHLLDKADGLVDGLPEALLQRQYALPWMKLMQEKIKKINAGSSDINPYGGTQEAEFLPVVSEYFFKRPKLLKRKHPRLYSKLERIFKQDPAGFA